MFGTEGPLVLGARRKVSNFNLWHLYQGDCLMSGLLTDFEHSCGIFSVPVTKCNFLLLNFVRDVYQPKSELLTTFYLVGAKYGLFMRTHICLKPILDAVSLN